MILADTHVLIWWLTGERPIPSAASQAIADAGRAAVSVASVWELSIKVSKHGDERYPGLARVLKAIRSEGLPAPFETLGIAIEDAVAVRDLPAAHGDPFDRMIAAQAMRRGLTLVSADPVFEAYRCRRIW